MRGARTVGIVGLGLIGGSLARDLARRGWRVLAHDRDERAVAAAVGAEVAHAALGPDLRGLSGAGLVVLAVPVTAARATLEACLPHLGEGAVVTDAGSTKAPIVRAAEELGLGDRFVGSHPLTGDHRSGWEAAREGLFAGGRVLLCPTPRTTDAALHAVAGMWAEVGARAEVMEAAAHDRRLAWSSHLPQAAATALAGALAAAGVPRSDLGPGGRDTTRLAGSSPEMWTGVCLENAAALDAALAGLEASLGGLRAAIRDRDAERIHAAFTAGRAWWAEGG